MLQVFVVVNYQSCGWCRKLQPVLKSVLKSMNPKAQAMVKVVELDTPEGAHLRGQLQFSGGIPCVLAFKDGKEVLREAGFKESTKLSQLFLKIWQQFNF